MKSQDTTPVFEVWFYIGALLGFYGLMLTCAGVYQWSHLPATILAEKHATFWAGVALLLIGGTYTAMYWPTRRTAANGNGTGIE